MVITLVTPLHPCVQGTPFSCMIVTTRSVPCQCRLLACTTRGDMSVRGATLRRTGQGCSCCSPVSSTWSSSLINLAHQIIPSHWIHSRALTQCPCCSVDSSLKSLCWKNLTQTNAARLFFFLFPCLTLLTPLGKTYPA